MGGLLVAGRHPATSRPDRDDKEEGEGPARSKLAAPMALGEVQCRDLGRCSVRVRGSADHPCEGIPPAPLLPHGGDVRPESLRRDGDGRSASEPLGPGPPR